MNSLELKTISFSYDDILVFKNLSIKVMKGHNISIIGNIASGKTTLTNILNYKIKTDGQYLINGVEVVKENDYVVDRFINTLSITDKYDNKKVIDLLFDKLGDNNNEDIKNVVSYFKIDDYLNNKINELTYELKYYVLIIINLLDKDKYLILDDVLCYLNNNHIKKVYSYAKKNKVTIINITSTLDNVFNSEYLIFIYKGKVAMEGEVLSCLKEEKLIKRLGYKLPFMYDLSLQLNYYEVLDNIYLDYKDMESAIWK